MRVWEQIKAPFALKPASSHELAGIQYVRAFAALLVVACHASAEMGEPKYFGRHPLAEAFDAAGVGVDLFFCLSGFIIVYIAADAAWRPTMGAWVFFKRRFARIVPFLWAVIISYALLRLAGRNQAFPALDYLRAAVVWPFGAVAPSPVWTLRHEFLFYCVFALTFLSGRRWLLAAWALSPLVLVAIQALFGRYVGLGPDIAWFLFNPIDLLFGMGVVLGLIYVRYREVWKAGTRAGAATVIGCALVFGLAVFLDYSRVVVWQVVLVGMASCICLAVACAVPAPRGFIGDLGRRFGDASYCIYLTHVAFVSAVLGVISHRARGLPDWAILLASFSVAALGGLALHYLAERPIVAWSQRLIFPRRIEGR